MIQHKIYKDFSEVEEDIKANAPPLVYKYRTWLNDYHRRLLTDREAWFAHPFALNDPYDIRRPYRINTNGYNSPEMLAKLWEHGRAMNPGLGDLELSKEVGERWQKIQADPIKYFQGNIDDLYRDKDLYGRIGVFSTSMDGLNDKMWSSNEYSDNHRGYCMGFNTLELARAIQCFIGEVEYTSEDLEVMVIEGYNEGHSQTEVLRKYPDWKYEKEFRLLSFDINNEERIKHFSVDAVAEVLIGRNATTATEKEIIYNARRVYGMEIPIYKIVPPGSDSILEKKLLSV